MRIFSSLILFLFAAFQLSASSIDAGDKKTASGGFSDMQKAMVQAVSKGLIHKNQVARKKSRLSAKIKAL